MMRKTLLAITAAAACAASVCVSTPAFSAGYPLVTTTESGRIQGFTKYVLGTKRRVDVYLGVPYAQPPVGDLRFAAPKRHADWKGVRDGSIMPPACKQASGGSEDCLYLNIYRPAGKVVPDKVPVLLYVHGGANVRGGASGVDGARLASYSDIMVVTVQHRLGAFGFLNLPQMLHTEAGNLGILDLEEALRWLRRNIQHFGGDPENITLAGQSSGATNACRMLVDKQVKGLFHGVILQSDDCLHDVDTPDVSRARSQEFVKAVGCSGAADQLKCLRELPADKINEASRKLRIWNPTASMSAVSQIAAGNWNTVPVLMGANANEGRAAGRAYLDADIDQYEAWVKGLVGERNARKALMRYPAYKYSSKYAIPYVMGDFITDSGMRGLGGCTSLALARAFVRGKAPGLFVYEFNERNAPMKNSVPDYETLASHGAELAYLWPDTGVRQELYEQFTDRQRDLSYLMRRYWARFARAKTPNSRHLPEWPAYGKDGIVMTLSSDGSRSVPVEQLEEAHKCSFWDSIPLVMGRGDELPPKSAQEPAAQPDAGAKPSVPADAAKSVASK